MWQLSEHVRNIILHLYELAQSQTWLSRLAGNGRESEIIQRLKALADANEPGALPCAARFLPAANREVRNAARNTVSGLMAKLRPDDLIHLSTRMGSYYGRYRWYISDKWDRLQPADVARVAAQPDGSGDAAVLGLLSFHANGYVRHEAVRQLRRLRDGGELPFLLIRLNDWVEPIAADARTAVAERITDSYVQHLVHSLDLILHLNTKSRRDHHDVVRRIIGLLLDDRHWDVLAEVVTSSDTTLRRQAFDYAIDAQGAHQIRLIRLGIGVDDPLIRLAAVQRVGVAYKGEELRSILHALSADPFMPIRRVALLTLAEQFPAVAGETWKRALLDRSRSIRELARFRLRKLNVSEADIVALYREQLSRQPEHFPALQGLAETAEPQDLNRFRELLQHQLPSRRVIGINGLARLLKASAVDELSPLLKDGSPQVGRQLRKAIGSHAYTLPGDALVDAAVHAGSAVARRNVVRLVAELGKWRSIPLLLLIAAEADDATARLAEEKVLWWFAPPQCNHVFTQPTAQEQPQIASALLKAQSRISDRVREIISQALRDSR